jgi:hypothetical protein
MKKDFWRRAVFNFSAALNTFICFGFLKTYFATPGYRTNFFVNVLTFIIVVIPLVSWFMLLTWKEEDDGGIKAN